MNEAIRSIVEQAQAQERLRRAMIPDADLLARFRTLSGVMRDTDTDALLAGQFGLSVSEQLRRVVEASRLAPGITDALGAYADRAHLSETRSLYDLMTRLRTADIPQHLYERALDAARISERFSLPGALADYRPPTELLAARLSVAGSSFAFNAEYVNAFAQTSAFATFLTDGERIGDSFVRAREALNAAVVPPFDTLRSYRQFLDAAGLTLPHWPSLRLLTLAEKRRRFRARVNTNAEPPHVRKAKSLVYKWEITLQEIIDAVMAEVYGENWPEERLPLCNCKDLLGRWKNRGGALFEHADYAHYARIMSHPEHFAAIFNAGFDDPGTLAALLDKAGALRARSHHPRPFTVEDLRDLRVTWRAIETGLVAFTADYNIEFD